MRMVIQGSYQIIYCLALGFLLHLIPFLCADEGSNTKKPIQYRNQGDRAYKNQSYSSAERFYRQYWKHADNEALIVDAAIALLKSLIIQDEDGSRNAAFDVIDKTLERLDRFHPETTEEGVSTHKAQLLYWKGRLYYDAASYEEALKSFQSALSSPDTLSRARVFLGIAQSYMALKQWPHAIKAVDNARKLEANDRIRNDAAIIDIKLALLQNQMERAEELINDHWRNADKTFQSRLAILRITLELKQKKTKEAFQFFHKNSATIDWNLKEPDVYPILYQLAKTLHKEKLFSEAYTVFSTLLPRLHREKHRQDTLLAAAETAVAAKKIAIAINNYKTFIQLYKDHDPRVDKLELIVADLYRDSKNNKLAIDTYRTIHSNQKRDPALRYQALYRLATLYFEQKNYQNAIEAFRAAAALDIEDTDKIHCLMFEANAYFKLKNYAKSAQTYEKISQRFPNSPWAPDADYNAALNFYNGKQYAKAIEQFIQFSQKWPGGTEQMAQARLLTGLSQRRMAQYNDAMKTLHDFISTYQQHEDIPLALLEIAEALTASNKLEVAVIYLGRIIEKYSETAYYPQALYHRAALKLSLGEKNALADSFLFVTKFSQAYPLLASDVYFWIGDYYSNHNDHQSARRFFLEIVKQFPNSENAASALYEAANNSFLFTHLPEFNIAQKNEYLQEAQTQLQRSLKDYPKSSRNFELESIFSRQISYPNKETTKKRLQILKDP